MSDASASKAIPRIVFRVLVPVGLGLIVLASCFNSPSADTHAKDAAPEQTTIDAPQNLAPHQVAKAEVKETAKATRIITFDDIKFDIEKHEPFERRMLTPKIEKLVTQRVRVRGYMLNAPMSQITEFILMRDNMECCFGPEAALYDCIYVVLKPGKTTKFTDRYITVEGEFQVDEKKEDDGMHIAIYQMSDAEVK